jgi:peptidoglycan hydrolase-like protein with peptidoglycan-binding domain
MLDFSRIRSRIKVLKLFVKFMKKIIVVFVLFLFIPSVSHAGLFDFFKINFKNLSAQTRSAVSTEIKVGSFSRGDRYAEISYIQDILAAKGYYNGKISGTFGARTEKAIMNWQAKNNLKTTGKLDQETIESIVGIKTEGELRGGGGFFLANIKMLLSGSYDPATELMSTSLNDANLIPLMEPYSDLDYYLTEDDSQTEPEVFNITGPNAIVDWVVVQLRNSTDMRDIKYSIAALLQSDGDIVDVDGVSPLAIQNLPPENYYVLVAHRNHLPIITQAPVDITQLADMTTAALYYDITMPGSSAKIINGKQVLWPGDVNHDNFIIYTGNENDRDPILQRILC